MREGEESEVVREMDGGWVWNMRGSRVFLVYIYIYMGFLVILYLNGSGPDRV